MGADGKANDPSSGKTNRESMTKNRLIILIVLLIVGGIALASQMLKQQPQPLYGFAVFGTQAEINSLPESGGSDRIEGQQSTDSDLNALPRANFIVVDRAVFYDANENKIPERSEKFTGSGNSFEIFSADGKSRYRLTKAVIGLSPDNVSDTMPQQILMNVDIYATDKPDSLKYQQAGMINAYPQPVQNGWAHFDGPLSFQFVDQGSKLAASGGPTVDLRLSISTPRDEYQSSTGEKIHRNMSVTSPGTLVPIAQVKFPAASGQTITKHYDMAQFC